MPVSLFSAHDDGCFPIQGICDHSSQRRHFQPQPCEVISSPRDVYLGKHPLPLPHDLFPALAPLLTPLPKIFEATPHLTWPVVEDILTQLLVFLRTRHPSPCLVLVFPQYSPFTSAYGNRCHGLQPQHIYFRAPLLKHCREFLRNLQLTTGTTGGTTPILRWYFVFVIGAEDFPNQRSLFQFINSIPF